MKITTNFIKQTKRHFSASGSILLPLALKWSLVGVVAMCVLSVFAAQSVSAASLEITMSPKPLSVDVSPTKDASFSKADGTLSVSSDAYWGYTLSVKSGDETGSNALKNGANEIPSITSNLTESQFTANSWGFAFEKGTSAGTTFQPGPNGINKELSKTTGNGAETVKNEDKYTFTLGAKVNNTIPTGIYSNTFVFMVTANTASYTITYDAGTAEGAATGLPSTTNGTTYNLTGQVAKEEPKYNKYVFMGWCDTTPTTDEEGIEICNDGNQYEPSGDYQIAKANGNNLKLTAMWGPAMQNWDGCKLLSESTTIQNNEITLVDSRDRKRYYVAKLADENCWMTENLDLDIDQNKTYTAADTDLGYASDDGQNGGGNGNSTYTWHPDKSTYTTGDTTWNRTRNNGSVSLFGNGDTIQQSYDPGDFCWNGIIEVKGVSGTEWFNQHSVTCKKHQQVNGSNPHYHIGNYYNYGAAVAQNDTSSKYNDGDHYDTSICPAGWQLPPISVNKSFQNLFEQAKAKGSEVSSGVTGNIQNAPYYFPYSSAWRSFFVDFGYSTTFRPNAVASSIDAYYLSSIGTGDIRPQGNWGWRHDGFSVRCVSRQ